MFHFVANFDEMVNCIKVATGHQLVLMKSYSHGTSNVVPIDCENCATKYNVYVFDRFYYIIKHDADSSMQIGVYDVVDKRIDMVKGEPYCVRFTSMI